MKQQFSEIVLSNQEKTKVGKIVSYAKECKILSITNETLCFVLEEYIYICLIIAQATIASAGRKIKLYHLRMVEFILILTLLTSCSGVQLKPDRERFHLKNIKIVMIESDQDLPPGMLQRLMVKKGIRRGTIAGVATSGNTIYIVSGFNKKGFKFRSEVLGHEIEHLLHWKYPKYFKDPDKRPLF